MTHRSHCEDLPMQYTVIFFFQLKTLNVNRGDTPVTLRRLTHAIYSDFLFSAQNIECEPRWGQHISEISCKATKTMLKTLGFLSRRNLALAPWHTKEVAYKTLVRPQLEYAAPIWHPYNETEKKRWRKCRRQQPGGPAQEQR